MSNFEERGEITVRTLADSITDGGSRLITQEWTYPRCVHSEVLTHGDLRRNSASSRAIPAKRLRELTLGAPYVPWHWGQNEKGMQASGEVDDWTKKEAEWWWRNGLNEAADLHKYLEDLGLHKQVLNRVIEPWMMITIIVSATDWANFFHQRTHKAAEPAMQKLAKLAWTEFHESMPVYRAPGEWHLPMITNDDRLDALGLSIRDQDTDAMWEGRTLDTLKKVSTGRCARVSYLTHDGKRDLSEDIGLHDRLLGTIDSGDPGHFSPFEHPCQAVGGRQRIGPFEGWKQYRKFLVGEAGPDTTIDRCEKCGCWNGRHVSQCPAQHKEIM